MCWTCVPRRVAPHLDNYMHLSWLACTHPSYCDQATGMHMYARVVMLCILCASFAVVHLGVFVNYV